MEIHTYILLSDRYNIIDELGAVMARHQVATKATLSLPFSSGQVKCNMMEDSWVNIKTGRDHCPVTIMGKKDLT